MSASSDPPKKKSRFTRPSWASKLDSAVPPSGDSADPFSRSKDTLEFLQKQRVVEPGSAREEDTGGKDGREGETPSKRRRLSADGSGDGSDSSMGRETSTSMKKKGGTVSKSEGGPNSERTSPTLHPSPKDVKGGTPRKRRKELVIIDIESSDDNEDTQNHSPNDRGQQEKSKAGSPILPTVEKDLFTDEELYSKPDEPNQSAGVKPIKDNKVASQTLTPEPTASPRSPNHISTSTASPHPSHGLQSSMPDVPISILIDPRIPNTDPLIVTRKLSQRLKEVREAWLSRQDSLSPEEKSQVFLTWRGQRIFDFTTCKSLGICVNEMGEIWFTQRAARGRREAVEPDEENGQITLQAVTEQILLEEKRKKDAEKSREAQKKAGRTGLVVSSEAPSAEGKVRIILRAKGLGEYKLQVKQTTKFQQIVVAAKKYYKVDDSKDLFLMFDGERLDNEHEMSSLTDFEPEDFLDVMIR